MPKTDTESRPTLPSIQDLLSDLEFDKLRLQSVDKRSRVTSMVNLTPSHPQVHDAELHSRNAPSPRQHRQSRPGSPHSPKIQRPVTARGAPYTNIHPISSPPHADIAGKAFEDHLPGIRNARLIKAYPPHALSSGRSPSASQILAGLDLPTYVLSPDQCPPDDDRRHGCGICHRRFNRPSSLMIHMNSHTGAQPFECPFPGCTRRFSVNSNMRRHYRNHRDGAAIPPQLQSYVPSYHRTPVPSCSYYGGASCSSSSPPSSPAHTDDDHFDAEIEKPEDNRSFGRIRSRSDALPAAHDRPASRPRSCTFPGCNCSETPSALRPTFQ
ncbi:hypothetical protein BD311DRAFT_705134 [Dichomitus squalens]|uniref:C2H2-type domain-containing protein n=1 Tax=Dichomitus squalens TaxID=114155 RepID=A0A4Q9M6L7_9APHY|nr:hypothetical protein BD311DRAFT_705134 [Dichomitus squalens]